MESCKNTIETTGELCGANADGPFDTRFCSEECEDRANREELATIGITPELMREALAGYYECKDMLDTRSEPTDPESESGPCESSTPQ